MNKRAYATEERIGHSSSFDYVQNQAAPFEDPGYRAKAGAKKKPAATRSGLAGVADHLDLGHVEVAVFLGVGVHSGFGLFLSAVHIGMPDLASNGYGVTDVWRELHGFALYFPGASVVCGDLEFIGAVAFGQ